MNWQAVVWAGIAAGLVFTIAQALLSQRWNRRDMAIGVGLSWISATMLGHALARIGPDKLAVKPQLYFMQSGGLALAFVIPALWLIGLRDGKAKAGLIHDSAALLLAYLAMGAVFWALGR